MLESFYRRLQKRFLIFFIFVIIAFFFWLYRALDDTYVENIKCSVSFINLPKNKIPTNKPPEKIVLRVRGDGYSILSKKLNAPELTFDVNNFRLHSQSLDSLSVYLITKSTYEILSQQLKSENERIEIISILPDTIFFNFAKTRQKKLPITPVYINQKKLFAQQYTLNGKMELSSDSVFIIGPAKIVDTVTYINTEPVMVTELKDTLKASLKLMPVPGTKLSAQEVFLTVPVDRFTESSFNLPLKVKHEPDSILLKVFPRTVKINYRVTLSQYSKITESDFYPYVDYNDINNKNKNINNSKISVYMDSIPEHAISASIYPTSVEFLIESRNDKNWNNRWNR